MITSLLRTATMPLLLAAFVCTGHVHAQTWEYFGTDFPSRVRAIATQDDDVYLGGDFRNVAGNDDMSFVTRWDGSDFHSLGRGVNARVYAVETAGSNVFVTGRITEAYNSDGTTVEVAGIARWDGSEWHALGSGIDGPNSTVGYALEAHDNTVFVGGDITSAGDIDVNNIAAWDNSTETWANVGSGLDGLVSALVYNEDEDVLYAGGDFDSTSADLRVNNIAMWNASTWSEMNGGFPEPIHSLSLSETWLWAGGGSGAAVLSRWDGSAWEDMDSGFDGYISAALAPDDDALVVSGPFSSAGGVPAQRLAMNREGEWSELGTLDEAAIDIELYGDRMVIAGDFQEVNAAVSHFLVVFTPPDATATQSEELPPSFALLSNYPNPFNPTTTIHYSLSEAGFVTLVVTDLLGRQVAEIVSRPKAAGEHSVRFDARAFPSGTYYYTVHQNGRTITRSMILAK